MTIRTILPVTVALLVALGTALGLSVSARDRPKSPRPVLALFTSLPIYWVETADVSAMLAPDQAAPWVRTELERDHALAPLDTLDDLSGQHLLLMAQPRPLAPVENVALDNWVRGGGRLLLFVDPALTQHSMFGLGDPRRPQDVALLSPILARWGLALEFDEDQRDGEFSLEGGAGSLGPFNLPGRFALLPGSACTLEARRIVARCRIDNGLVVAVADSAVLESGHVPDHNDRARWLVQLIKAAFAT